MVEFVVDSVVVVPLTVKFPVTVRLPPTVGLVGKPIVIVPELSATSTSLLVPEKVIVPPNAVAVELEPSVTVIVELLNDELPIFDKVFEAPDIVLFVSVWLSLEPTTVPDGIAFCEAEPSIFPEAFDNTKLEAAIPERVLLSALIVLFVSVFDVPENKVSNWDSKTLPSVPPSDNNSLSPTANVALSKSVAPSILTIASTLPNSNALAPELTFNTWPALPIDNETPRPPCVKPTVSPDWNSANPVATLLSLKTALTGFLSAIFNS